MLFYGIEEGAPKRKSLYRNAKDGRCTELAPRLQEVFPSITVAALYGGSVDHKKMQR